MIKLSMSVALLAAVAMVGLACGGSSSNSSTGAGTSSAAATATAPPAGGSDESDYFTQLASIFAGGQTGSNDASTKLNNDLGSAQTLDDNRAAINTFLDSMVGVFSTAITRMQALNPPDDARDAHNKFLQDVQNAKTKSSDLKGQLANASTIADFHTIVNDFNTEVDALVSDANVACVALQDLDNQHGANVDLSCNQ
ncbi:MAG TPA: hypothetical protein VIP09_01330 [Dehalococcoidia bacterium]|jgi:hypothetical protein